MRRNPSRHTLSRRTLLRGATAAGAVSLAVPMLEAMLDHSGEAYADGSEIPQRFGFWWWGSGKRPQTWREDQVLAPLVQPDISSAVSILRGLRIPVHNRAGHYMGMRMMESGSANNDDWNDNVLPNVAEVAAQHLGKETPIKMVEMGVSRSGWKGSKLRGDKYDARALWDNLFEGYEISTDPIAKAERKARGQALDAVLDDAASLKKRLGERDRTRIDEHLEHVHAIQKRLDGFDLGTCSLPPRPGTLEDYQPQSEPLQERARLMHDILVVALACDITRVFRYDFTRFQAGTVFWMLGTQAGHHDLTHGATSAEQSQVNDNLLFTMEELAYFVRRLGETPMGAGSLLDHMGMLATSELGDSKRHTCQDMPCLVIGRGGDLKGGVRHQYDNEESTSRVHLTLLKTLGCDVDGFGMTGQEPDAYEGKNVRASQVLPELLA